MTAPERITAWGDYTSLGINYKAGPRPMENMVVFPATEYTRTDLIPAMIQAAVDAEREACALVAQRQHNVWQSQGNACLVDDDVSACANIAAAIRARKGGVE